MLADGERNPHDRVVAVLRAKLFDRLLSGRRNATGQDNENWVDGKATQRARVVGVVDHTLRLNFDDGVIAGPETSEMIVAARVGGDANWRGGATRIMPGDLPGRPRSDHPKHRAEVPA